MMNAPNTQSDQLAMRAAGPDPAGLARQLPALDFGSWSVPFPERGHHLFLSSDDPRAPQATDPPAPGRGIWLLRTEAGLGVIIPSGAEVVRSGVPIVSLATLHHGEQIEFAQHLARFLEIQRVIVNAGAALSGRQCPHCLSVHEPGKQIVRCPFCSEGYCLDCWDLLAGKRCCSRDCLLSPGRLTETDL